MKIDLKHEWKRNKLYIILGVLCIINFIAHLCFYPALPDTVPIHWGINGTVDGYGPKGAALLLALLPVVMVVLFCFVPRIDPKAQNYEKFKPVWNTFVTVVTIFFIGISWLTEFTVFGALPETSNIPTLLVGGGCGLLFIILGNYMPRIKQNYTFGCKTPWALADEHNWNRTQRMGGITFVVIGAVMLLCAILLYAVSSQALGTAFIVAIAVAIVAGTAWIYLYSYLVFAGKMK